MTYGTNLAEYLSHVAGIRPLPDVVTLTESAVLVAPHRPNTDPAPMPPSAPGPMWLVKIIAADVQGASGYYPADVLRRDGPTVFHAGTHVYLDHPTVTENENRPERSVRDLAGVLTQDARFEDPGAQGPGLYAPMQVFPDHAERITALAPHVGMSIRGQGRQAPDGTVTELLHADSVDIVTRAGAGGRLIAPITPGGW